MNNKERSWFWKYGIAILEFCIAWGIAIPLFMSSGDVLTLIIGGVGTYVALITLVFTLGQSRTEERIKQLDGGIIFNQGTMGEIKKLNQGIIQSLQKGLKSIEEAIERWEYARSWVEHEQGRHEVVEHMATELMREYAGKFQQRMISTSYFDLAAWSKKNEKESFWGVYDINARISLERITQGLRANFHNEEELLKHLQANPVITRIFILEEGKWLQYRSVVRGQMDTPGYEVRCALKDQVIREELADEAPHRIEHLHDCVMFDNSIIIEVLQEKSQWPGNPVNMYGLVFTPALKKGDSWIRKFGAYFDRLIQISFSCDELDNRCQVNQLE